MRHTITMDVEAPETMTAQDVALWAERAMKLKWENYLREGSTDPHPLWARLTVVNDLPEMYAFYGALMTWQTILGDKDVKHIFPWPAMPTIDEAAFAAWGCVNRYRLTGLLPNFLGQGVVNE